jgi:hypothetical protein
MSRESSGVIAIAEPRVERGAVVLQSSVLPPDELLGVPPPAALAALPVDAPLAPPAPAALDEVVGAVLFDSAVSPHPPLIAAAPPAIAAIQPKWRSAERPVEALLPKLIMQALLREAIQCCSRIGSPAGTFRCGCPGRYPSSGNLETLYVPPPDPDRALLPGHATVQGFSRNSSGDGGLLGVLTRPGYRWGVDRRRHRGRTRTGRAAGFAAPCALALLAVAHPAHAGPFEVMGFGPEGIAAINARAARAEDGTATFYNPGGLGFGRGTGLSVAPTVGVSALSAQGRALPLEDPFGVALSFATTIPLSGPLHDRIRVGFGGYFLPTGVLHLLARPIDAPVFPYYDNRTQRLVLIPALAVRLTERLAVGAGVNVLGGVTGPASVRPGASGAPESRLDLAASATAALHLGLRFDPTERVRLALAFRQRFAVPALITTTAEVAGVPLEVTVKADGALADPMTLVLASSFDLGRATIEIDAMYAMWSAAGSPHVFVRAELPGLNLASDLPEGTARDVVSLRAAAAYRFQPSPRAELSLQGGAGFEPTMLKSSQQGRENLLDGHKALLGLGVSLALRDLGARPDRAPWARALRFAAGVGAQIVLPYAQDKRACAAAPCPADTVAGPDAARPGVGIDNPGFPRLTGHGTFWSTSFGVGVDL